MRTHNPDFVERYGIGTITHEEERGRRYYHVRVTFPGSAWWPRTTETITVSAARAWINKQAAEWREAQDRSSEEK